MASKEIEYLAYLVESGIHSRYPDLEYVKQVILPRIQIELNVIVKQQLTSYFLILADILGFCRKNNIPVGPARGSSGGSVVCYCTGITDIDPLEYGLIFERFINEERLELADIDTDICWHDRQRVIDYIVSQYGENRTTQIVTFNTLAPKALLQDVGRVLHLPKHVVENLKAAIPEEEDITIDTLMANINFMNLLQDVADREPRLIPALRRLEGIHRNESIHAGGVVISHRPIDEIAPTFQKGGVGRKSLQFEMDDAAKVGLLKMDILGLKTLTLIEWAERNVREFFSPTFNIRTEDKNCQITFDIVNRGDTTGIFQLEGTGITNFARDMRLSSFNDVVALLALFRPGTLDSGSAYQYIERKLGKAETEYLHPDLREVLVDTYGILVYQEQVMKVFNIMGGYSLGQADIVRKAMGKKDDALMDTEIAKFKRAALTRGYDTHTVERVADLIKTFARYGFNKSHAVAYAHLTYWTALLKARYPIAFYTAYLNINGDVAKQGHIINLAVRSGIKILPPDINYSGNNFCMTDQYTIRFGLSAIKGIGDKYIDIIINEREVRGPFASFSDFCNRLTSLPINIKIALVSAGAFDFDCHRKYLIEHARSINYTARGEHKKAGQLYDVEPLLPIELAELEFETMGYHITINPMVLLAKNLEQIGVQVGVPDNQLTGKPCIGGIIREVRVLATKKGDKMAFLNVDDGIETHRVTCFPSVWQKVSGHCCENKAVVIKCTIGNYKGRPSLEATSVKPLHAQQQHATLVLELAPSVDMLTIAQIKFILDKCPSGGCNVLFRLSRDGHHYIIESGLHEIKISDDLLNPLRQILGNNNVKIQPR